MNPENKIFRSSRDLQYHLSSGPGTPQTVFVAGVYDLLHVGHTRFLQAAARLGTVLIVGVNTDWSVYRNKKTYPVIQESLRAEMVASLDCVNYVVLFDEVEPTEAITSLHPHFVVKGVEWANKLSTWERKAIAEAGSQLLFLQRTEGISTTEIKEKIIKENPNGKGNEN